METDPTEKTDKPKTIGPVKIEWTQDFDYLWLERKSSEQERQEYTPGKEGRFRLKGRCRSCWGGLIGEGGAEHVPTAIRCRVCGTVLKGANARTEYQQMLDQSMSNTDYDFPANYRADATFVQKVFPNIDRQSGDELRQRINGETPKGTKDGWLTRLRQRINAKASKGTKDGWLTRSTFPAGSVGFLFLQARALMSGVERLPRELSVAPVSDFDKYKNGHKTREYELMKRLGSTMTIAMMSAFACELAMKAIRLTRMDEARKSHDLWQLYRDLPPDSKARIEEDFPEVGSVLKSARHTFDKWRYFEANVGGRGMSAMIDTDRAFALAKAARVLLDEVEMMGLGYSVKVEATRKVTKIDDRQNVHVKHHLSTTGTEAPPR